MKKSKGTGKEAVLSLARKETLFLAIQEISCTRKGDLSLLCALAGVSRSGYYKWLLCKQGRQETLNQKLCELIGIFYKNSKGVLGYRQMALKLNRETKFRVNEKRVLRLMRILGLKSVCRRSKRTWKPSDWQVIAENRLNREFHAQTFGQKWLTDITEMKYGTGKKAYLSAILDLSDKSIVAFKLGHSNNNELVFETFDAAHLSYPDMTPLFHSDRGYQYTSKSFKKKLDEAGMTQSMSRVGKCIDNGPMESFWGTLKTEMYYLERFESYEDLRKAVEEYIIYYNTKRYQKRLKGMTPMEYREHLKEVS